MRILMTAVAIALMTVSAQAQGMGRHKHQQDSQKPADKTKQKADDQAYKDALKRIPVPNGKPDPWKTMR